MIFKVKSLFLLFIMSLGSNLLPSKPGSGTPSVLSGGSKSGGSGSASSARNSGGSGSRGGAHTVNSIHIFNRGDGGGGGRPQANPESISQGGRGGGRSNPSPAPAAPQMTPTPTASTPYGTGQIVYTNPAPAVLAPSQQGTGALPSGGTIDTSTMVPGTSITVYDANTGQTTTITAPGRATPSAPPASAPTPQNPPQPTSGGGYDSNDYSSEDSYDSGDSILPQEVFQTLALMQEIFGRSEKPSTPQSPAPQSKPEAQQAKAGNEKARSESSTSAEASSSSGSAVAAAKPVKQSAQSDEGSANDNEIVDPAKQEYEAAEYESQKNETERVYNYVLYLPSYSQQELIRDIETLSKKIDQVKLEYLSLSSGISISTTEGRLIRAQSRLAAADRLSHWDRIAAYKKEAQLRVKESEYSALQKSLAACSKACVENKKLFDEQLNLEKAKKEAALKEQPYTHWEFDADKQIEKYRASIANGEKEIKNMREQYAQLIKKINAFDGYHPMKKGWAYFKGMLWNSEHYTSLKKQIENLNCELAKRQSEVAALKNNVLVLQLLKSNDHHVGVVEGFTAAYESAINSFSLGQSKERDEFIVALTPNQKHLLLQSNIDAAIFEAHRSNDAQNHIFKKLNEALTIAAEAQAKNANAQKIDPYNQAVALLCAMSHNHHQQGRINDAQTACGLAQAIAQTIVINNHAPNSDIVDIVQDIERYISEAIQNISDNNFLASFKDKWIELRNNPCTNTTKEVSLLLGMAGAGSLPASSGANLGTGTLSITFEAILADQVAAMGAVSAAAAVDPRPPLFRAIDEALKPIEQMNTNGKNQGAGNKDKNIGSAGASKAQEHPHGTYKDAGYHHVNSKSGKNPPPQNGQKALDNSILIKNTSPNRVAVEGDSFVMLRETRAGSIPEFHGNLQTWKELSQEAQTALREAGICNHKGKILRRID